MKKFFRDCWIFVKGFYIIGSLYVCIYALWAYNELVELGEYPDNLK